MKFSFNSRNERKINTVKIGLIILFNKFNWRG